MDTTEITNAYQRLRIALRGCHQATEAAIDARARLKASYLANLVEGKIAGSNENQREASARQLLADLYVEVNEAERGERLAKLGLDLAQADLSEVRARLRLEELSSQERAVTTVITDTEEEPPF